MNDIQKIREFFSKPVNEAKKEDAVDTITMDVPLFIRMLEYSREDAEQDLDLHDVTEKANKLGKERGILQMEDYDEIVGAAENKIKEAELNEALVRADKLVGISNDAHKEKKLLNVSFKGKDYAIIQFLHMHYKTVVFKTDKGEVTFKHGDMVTLNEVDESTDYMKRRKAMDDYAVNKKDKPAKSNNEKPSGNTDYMKSRKKDLAERIHEALNKINEELCPAGKAYIKRRQAAGEKSSAYLSGRGVKVCKGQMSGKAKKTK